MEVDQEVRSLEQRAEYLESALASIPRSFFISEVTPIFPPKTRRQIPRLPGQNASANTKARKKEQERSIIHYLRNNPKSTSSEIQTSYDGSNFRSNLRLLVARGTVYEDATFQPPRYSLRAQII